MTEEIDVIQFQLPQRYSLSEQGLKMSERITENHSEAGFTNSVDPKKKTGMENTVNLCDKRLSLPDAVSMAYSQSGVKQPTKASRRKAAMAQACTSVDLLESGDEDDSKAQFVTKPDNKSVATSNQTVVCAPVPAARLSTLHYWDLPKQSKTIQFLSQSMNMNDHPENTKPAGDDEKPQELLPAAPAASAPQVAKQVKVIVQEEPVEQSDRPTYRPRQAKRLYFTAE